MDNSNPPNRSVPLDKIHWALDFTSSDYQNESLAFFMNDELWEQKSINDYGNEFRWHRPALRKRRWTAAVSHCLNSPITKCTIPAERPSPISRGRYLPRTRAIHRTKAKLSWPSPSCRIPDAMARRTASAKKRNVRKCIERTWRNKFKITTWPPMCHHSLLKTDP